MIRARTTASVILLALLMISVAGCGGDKLEPASMTAVIVQSNDAPPAIPTGVEAAVSGSSVKIRWEPNVIDPDLAGYRIYRLAFGFTYLLTADLVTTTFWLDENPLFKSCYYAVSAVDTGGNESPWQEIAFTPVVDQPEYRDASSGD